MPTSKGDAVFGEIRARTPRSVSVYGLNGFDHRCQEQNRFPRGVVPDCASAFLYSGYWILSVPPLLDRGISAMLQACVTVIVNGTQSAPFCPRQRSIPWDGEETLPCPKS